MTALIFRFPEFHVRVERANEGGWMVLCRSHGWLHGDRDAAVEDARWIAAGYGTQGPYSRGRPQTQSIKIEEDTVVKLPTWRVEQLAGKRRPRRSNNAAAVLAKLEGGAVLYSGRVGDGRWWMLSDGTTLTGNTAKAVTSNPRVVDCGDSLFAGVRGQTFRYTGGEEPMSDDAKKPAAAGSRPEAAGKSIPQTGGSYHGR